MSELLGHLIPPYFELWHLPVVFIAGLIGEGYAVVVGGGGVLIQFVLLSLGLPLRTVVATDLAGCLGTNFGVIAAFPKNLWHNKRLLFVLGIPMFIGGVIGTVALIYIALDWLRYLLIIALTLLLLRMLFGKEPALRTTEMIDIPRRQYPLLTSIMFGLGVYGNASGVAAGTFQKMALVHFLRIRVADSIGISYIIELAPTIFSFAMTAVAGILAWPYLLTLWISTFIGGHYVAKYTRKVPDRYLRALLMIVSALYLIYLLSQTL